MRYNINTGTEKIGIEDYVKKMKPGQTNIYFVAGQGR
jgi:HSP90 family molecular chaperone